MTPVIFQLGHETWKCHMTFLNFTQLVFTLLNKTPIESVSNIRKCSFRSGTIYYLILCIPLIFALLDKTLIVSVNLKWNPLKGKLKLMPQKCKLSAGMFLGDFSFGDVRQGCYVVISFEFRHGIGFQHY